MEISLALGGGGSKGIAHLGVLRCLEREKIKVSAIAGTSAGGIVAALFSAGYSVDEIINRFKQLDFSQMYRHSPGDQPSLLGNSGIKRILQDLLRDRTFAELSIPTALTSVDLRSGKEVVLKHGNVLDAVMATIALPGIFPPVETVEFFLVDGGVLDPVPVDPARRLAPRQPVVAVVLNSRPPEPIESLAPPKILQNIPLFNTLARWRLAQAINIFVHSIEVANNYLTEMRLQVDRPELVIRPDVSDIGLLDRVNVDEIIERGDLAARENLPDLYRIFRWDRRLARMWSSK